APTGHTEIDSSNETHRDIPTASEACPVSTLTPCAQTAQHRPYSREKSKKTVRDLMADRLR
ncbi:hypothetical protein, partial [Porphyromonas loveana]|uniref:hypothetical protein n=1 Tax=Porphyromonas loveana TaxID=1884669 RepID=UPI0035A1C846